MLSSQPEERAVSTRQHVALERRGVRSEQPVTLGAGVVGRGTCSYGANHRD